MPAAPSISITQSSPSIPPGTSLQAAHNPPLQPAPQARLGGTFWGRDSPLEPPPALWGLPPAPGSLHLPPSHPTTAPYLPAGSAPASVLAAPQRPQAPAAARSHPRGHGARLGSAGSWGKGREKERERKGKGRPPGSPLRRLPGLRAPARSAGRPRSPLPGRLWERGERRRRKRERSREKEESREGGGRKAGRKL